MIMPTKDSRVFYTIFCSNILVRLGNTVFGRKSDAVKRMGFKLGKEMRGALGHAFNFFPMWEIRVTRQEVNFLTNV